MPTISGIVVSTGGQAEQRRQFSDIINELSRPIDAADESIRSLAADAFRSAVRWMNRKGNWPWEVQEEELTLTNGNDFVSATGAIKAPLAMHYLTGTGGKRERKLYYISYDRFMELYNHDVSGGEAHSYTVPNLFETGQIRIFPSPSATRFTMFTYYRVTPAPRNESEAVEIPDMVVEAYMARAWYEMTKRLPTEQRPIPIAIAMADSRQAFQEISAHVNRSGDTSRQINFGYGFGAS